MMRYLLSLSELKFLEGKAHRAFAIVGTTSIFVFLNDQLFSEIKEGVIDICSKLGAGFDHWDTRVGLLELLNLLVCHLNFGFVVHFVGKDHDLDVTAGMLFNLVEPYWYAQETLTIRQIKHHDYAIGTLVIGICDCAVAFLSGRVPNLKLNCTLVDLKGAEAEVDSNRANVVFLETVIL